MTGFSGYTQNLVIYDELEDQLNLVQWMKNQIWSAYTADIYNAMWGTNPKEVELLQVEPFPTERPLDLTSSIPSLISSPFPS